MFMKYRLDHYQLSDVLAIFQGVFTNDFSWMEIFTQLSIMFSSSLMKRVLNFMRNPKREHILVF